MSTDSGQALLAGRSVIAVSGNDARDFLQGLITNDVRQVTPQLAIFTALLSPQGKFLYDFFIIEHEGKLLLDIERMYEAELVKRLSMYKLRAQVEIAPLSDWQVAAVWGTPPAGQGEVIYADPRLPAMGVRMLGRNLSVAGDEETYHAYRLALAIPDGAKDLTQNRSLPMEWGYDKLNAIDFNKGCYVGQEVTARSKHRATLHKMVHRVQADTALPPRDTAIMSGEREVGQMASSNGNIGLAMLNLDAVASGAPLEAAGVKLQAERPAWSLIP
ncbi:MAG TPA: folate-binding protein [Rickettsiales bacterium]|nr:folate-binding protein [Rickettsiales bacterium]